MTEIPTLLPLVHWACSVLNEHKSRVIIRQYPLPQRTLCSVAVLAEGD